MQNKISLDQRLRMCADFVRQNARLADIGTDHAYLPLWLCLNGTCPSAIAADINPDPLSRGQAAKANECVSKVDFDVNSAEIKAFLHGEEVAVDNNIKGYTAVCVNGITVGFGKCSNGRLKNKYPKGLRLL